MRSANPVASALMAKMKIAPEDRPRVKLECLRMLVTLKLDKARATMISSFMDAYLKLTAAETVVYNGELQAVEPPDREVIMQWTNEWIERGKDEGRLEGRRTIIVRQLARRFGSVPSEIKDSVGRLSETQIDQLAEALLDFHDVEDMRLWLARLE